jgi:hypothetical protein
MHGDFRLKFFIFIFFPQVCHFLICYYDATYVFEG